ncbi:MAG: universal stress protein [Planctomycetales bacterium]|nr:universal stress protein [Planctomycetales bacterium]
MKIIFAVSHSQIACQAAELLTRLPWVEKPSICLISVMHEGAPSTFGTKPNQASEAEKRELELAQQQVGKILQAGQLSHTSLIVSGRAKQQLLDRARELEADLIVLGAADRSGLARAVLGSTSDYVANHAQCSTLIVHSSEKGVNDASGLKVVLAYDGSVGAQEACRQLHSFNWGVSSKISVAAFLERPSLLPETEIYDAEAIENAERITSQVCESIDNGAHVYNVVRESLHIGSGLQQHIHEQAADLVFCGATSASGISAWIVGSVTRHLLHHAHTSIWVAKQKNWSNNPK